MSNYINDHHKYLSKSQKSNLMERLTGMSFDKRISIISLAVLSGVTATAMAWHGTTAGRIYFCIQSPRGDICADKNNRPFRMTPAHWKQWALDGRPDNIYRKRYEIPTNPGKPFQAGWGFVSFGVAAWMFRQLKHAEQQKVEWDEIAEERNRAIAELTNQIDLMGVVRELELASVDNTVVIQQAELLSEVEIRLTQMETAEMIFEAETAGMSEEQKADYIDFLRKQQTPFLTGTQTISKTVDPRDKLEEQNQYQLSNWFTHAVDHFCVLVFGGQNGGKTTAASQIVKARRERGDRVIILDPHAEKGQWQGLEVIGAGMDYQSIDNFMAWYFQECERRYQILRDKGRKAVEKLGAICLVAEELSNYAKRCKNSGDFIQACLSDNRKIYFNCLFISHGRTLALTGGAQGTGKTRDDSFLELHCIPPTGGSSRIWQVKYPGGDFSPVDVPVWETIYNFEAADNHETPETEGNGSETAKSEVNISSDGENRRFTRFRFLKSEAKAEILRLRNEMSFNQTEIIKMLWGEKPGSSLGYQNAVSEFKELIDE